MTQLLKAFQESRRKITALFIGFNIALGLILLIVFLVPPSEVGNQLFLSLSAVRLVAGLLFAGLLLLNLGALIFTARNFGPRQTRLTDAVLSILAHFQVPILTVLYIVLISTGAFLILSIPPVIRPLTFMIPVATRFGAFIVWIFINTLVYIILVRLLAGPKLEDHPALARLDSLVMMIGLFLLFFTLYAQIAAHISWINKTRYSYWNLLAGQFLQGKLYLEHPPYTHDLTRYMGKWYIPMPPLPAILMMPLAFLFGAQNISTSYLSMVFSALNGMFLFLILKQINDCKWVNLSNAKIVLLVFVFLFGTPHLWVGISGRAWFVSQILTVTCLSVAIYGSLRLWSAWWIGSFIGAAILARPNAILIFPFVLAISFQLIDANGSKWLLRWALAWTIKSAIPIAVAVASLLFYNYLRFDDFFDFGYATLNGDPEIVQNAQTYGIFSLHFVPTNLQTMLFRWPRINLSSEWPIQPSTTGLSMFLTTPVLFYLFRHYPRQWWVAGAWFSIGLNVALLSLYHNTGAHQFGYRYILDMLLPIMVLLGFALDRKISWHFVLLALVSIAFNIYGANWFMNA